MKSKKIYFDMIRKQIDWGGNNQAYSDLHSIVSQGEMFAREVENFNPSKTQQIIEITLETLEKCAKNHNLKKTDYSF